MSETAVLQMNRIVQLVADLSRHVDADGEGVPIAEVAERLGVSRAQIECDLRTLTDASDSPDASWLHSLSIWQEGDRVSASSRGPFRRPRPHPRGPALRSRGGRPAPHPVPDTAQQAARRRTDREAHRRHPQDVAWRFARLFSPTMTSGAGHRNSC